MAELPGASGDPRRLARGARGEHAPARGRGPLRVTAAASAGQESVLFTALARMPNQPTDDLAPILREVGRRLTRRTTVVVLSASPGPALTHEMERLRRRGSDVIHVAPDRWEDRPGAAS